MGWLKRTSHPTVNHATSEDIPKPTSAHIEHIPSGTAPLPRYPAAPLSTPDAALQFIPAEEIAKRTSAESGGLLIVIDDIVYDCTQFLSEHPGGEQVIRSFAGTDCSWQFWRFHGKKEMQEFGRPLRVARTAGAKNRFKEPPRYIGLRRLGDEWD